MLVNNSGLLSLELNIVVDNGGTDKGVREVIRPGFERNMMKLP